MIRNKKLKKAEEIFFKTVMIISTTLIILTLGYIILSIFIKSIHALSWEMITRVPSGGYYYGKGGGILNAILGSLYLSVGATLLSMLISTPIALYMNVHLTRRARLVNFVRYLLDVIWGVPSIVYGAFGFTLMVFLGIHTSLLAGIITVTLFIIPIMVRAMDEVLKTIPIGLMESALSLGSMKSEVAWRVYLRQASSGILTAVLLAFGRGFGDAASVLFTAGYTDSIPTSLSEPVATLPLSIFFQLASPVPEVQERAYASAMVLTFIILIISIGSRVLTKKYLKNKIQ
ncbi:MAG: ABC transporter permease subunit [Bacteroidota bacterium]|nr:ABC transporter permease subunit [Bacteroidota bacterium]MDP4272925.1 ABC transporter permease subunit [Bacteroidota bacterium]